jgi:hypothetical protein
LDYHEGSLILEWRFFAFIELVVLVLLGSYYLWSYSSVLLELMVVGSSFSWLLLCGSLVSLAIFSGDFGLEIFRPTAEPLVDWLSFGGCSCFTCFHGGCSCFIFERFLVV